MTHRGATRLGLLVLLLLGGRAGGGPAEIADLQQTLAAIEAQIEAGTLQLREALGGYGGDAGEEGARLRALKLERARTRLALKQALGEQKERERAGTGMPAATPAFDMGRRAPKPEKPPALKGSPTGTPLPAPSL